MSCSCRSRAGWSPTRPSCPTAFRADCASYPSCRTGVPEGSSSVSHRSTRTQSSTPSRPGASGSSGCVDTTRRRSTSPTLTWCRKSATPRTSPTLSSASGGTRGHGVHGRLRLCVAVGRAHGRRQGRFLSMYADFHEFLADGCSRRQFFDGEPHQDARLEQVYMNSHVRGLVGDGCHVRHTAPVMSRHVMSDDIPMQVLFMPRPAARRTRIPPSAPPLCRDQPAGGRHSLGCDGRRALLGYRFDHCGHALGCASREPRDSGRPW